MRLIPRSLFGRLVLILVGGMVAAQAATSSIWFDVRHSQAMEIPTRLIATRLASILQLASREPGQVDALVSMLDNEGFRLRLGDHPEPLVEALSDQERPAERLLNQIIEQKTGQQQPLRLLNIALIDDSGDRARLPALLTARPTVGKFLIDLHLPDGRWLLVDAAEEQGWSSRPPWHLVLDYVLRIYVLRILVVVLIALVAVRLALAPVKRLAAAAQQLGQDINRAPLDENGPAEVRHAAQAFNVMQQRLIANIAERTRLLAAISHDLRSPITRLRLRAELVDEPTLKSQLCHDLQEMEDMVATTLDFVSSGEVTEARQQVDMNSLLMSLQADMQDIGHCIEIHGQLRIAVAGYPRSLKRCLQNLLENAVHYGDRATVTMTQLGGQLRIVVADRGPGLPAEMLERVFEPFYRADESRSDSGYGLGLSIARSVASAHGGRLTLRNAEQGGLEAVLELPCAVG